MSKIKEIKSNIENLEFEMDWMKKSIEREESVDELISQFSTTESAMQDLIEKVNDLIETLEELV